MMLLDTDILIDVALDRRPHYAPASNLLDRIEDGDEAACVAWHTVSNIYYVVTRETRNRDSALNFILRLARFATVAATDAESIRYAAQLPMSDFEDAMQVAAAVACGADFIVTRNLRDYRQSPIPAITPSQALDEIAG